VQVINGVHGQPTAGVTVRLARDTEGTWTELARCLTTDAGTVDSWPQVVISPGNYRLEFDTDAYFATLGVTPFYRSISLVFRLSDPGHPYRISLLVSPSSYVTYWQR
jgi:5-hydroxyisourate hydrolase